jgi:ABC-2 type transport system ATP-binding protein
MLLGQIKADKGTMCVLEHEIPKQLPDVISNIGAIVESPKFFPTFSAQLNLELLAESINIPRSRVGIVLEETGLTPRAKDKFSTYSLGMKQRLAVAATLLKDPEVLIFDEPTNGLDPAGIHEVREQLKALGAAGRTVLVSSHILSEIEQMADTLTIIARGSVLAQGKVSDITGAGQALEVGLGIDEITRGAEVLRSAGFNISTQAGQILVSGEVAPAQVTKTLADAGLFLERLVPRQSNLESIFLELTDGVGVGEMSLNFSGNSEQTTQGETK